MLKPGKPPPVGEAKRPRLHIHLSHYQRRLFQQLTDANGMGSSELFAAILNQGLVARLPIFAAVQPAAAAGKAGGG